jgi:hypothetical protein
MFFIYLINLHLQAVLGRAIYIIELIHKCYVRLKTYKIMQLLRVEIHYYNWVIIILGVFLAMKIYKADFSVLTLYQLWMWRRYVLRVYVVQEQDYMTSQSRGPQLRPSLP